MPTEILTLRQDIRYALRSLAKTPGFTLVVLLTLALGIGANTAIFSVVNGVLLRPLPYHEPERIIRIWETYGEGQTGSVSGPNFLDWRDRNGSFEQLAAYRVRALSALGEGAPEEVATGFVTSEFFRLLGLAPVLGRGFVAGEDQGPGTVAVIGDGYWRTRFAGDTGVLGRSLVLDGRPYTIVGVAPPGVDFPGRSQVWVPAELGVGRAVERGSHSYDVVGRLKPGVTLEVAQADLAAIAGALARDFPVTNAGRGVALLPLTSDTLGPVRPALLLLSGAVLFVLCIACANVANLFLARAITRQREIAVRSALGASRWRLARQVLVEAVVLAGAGGLAGLLLAAWGIELLLSLQPRGIPRLQEIGIDGATLAFTLVTSLAVGLGFGLFPALTLSAHDPADSLRGEGRGSSDGRRRAHVRSALVVAQVSLALVLLAGAALMVVTVRRLAAVDPGFQPDRAVIFQLPIVTTKYPTLAVYTEFVDRMLLGLASVTDAGAAGAVFFLPLGSGNVNGDFTVEGVPPPAKGRQPYADYRVVSGDFFTAMGVPLRRGRLLGPEDRGGAPPVALVSESFARRFLQGADPIGRRVTFGDGTDDVLYRRIVGVVADVRHRGLTTDPEPEIYVPLEQLGPDLWNVFSSIPLSVVVRSEQPVETLAPAVRAGIARVDPEQVVSALRPAGELVSDSIARQRFSMLLLLIFGGLALTLAGVGVYGVQAYAVSQRTRELGIRLALGARAGSVQALVLRQGLALTAAGIVLGLLGAVALGRLLAGLVYGVSPADPQILGVVALVLATASAVACLVPAVRASRVNPIDALRSE